MRTSLSAVATLVAAILTLLFTIAAAAQDFGRQRLPAEGLGTLDRMGGSVAIDGSYAVAGRAGAAHFYRWDGSQWYEEQVVSSAQNSFGNTVALDDECAAVGSPTGGSGQYYMAGEVHVYCRTGDQSDPWVLAATLHASNPAMDASFGNAIAMDGDRVVVAAYRGGPPEDEYRQSGAAYVFERNHGGTNNWGLVKHLSNPDGSVSGDEFGRDVAIRGDLILVGAPNVDDGYVYVFSRMGGAWNPVKKLVPAATASSGAKFGSAVALDPDIAVVAAPGEDAGGTNSGEVYVFQAGFGWNQLERLKGSDTGAGDSFGTSVAIDGGYVAVGAEGWDGSGGASYNDAGAAYLFRWTGSTLSELTVLENTSGAAAFGSSVDLSAGKLFVGASRDDARGNDAGAAFAFVVVPETPGNFRASDGSSVQNISLSWAKSVGADGYRIYRDGGASPIEEPTGLSYNDQLAPGEVHSYEIVAYNSIAESAPASDVGRTRANGEIRGTVSSSLGTGVLGARVNASPYLNQAVKFDGVDDYIEITHTDALDVSDAFIIEAWIKPDVVTGRRAIFSTRVNDESGSFQLEIGDVGLPGSSGRVAVTSVNTYLYLTDNNVIAPGEWSHIRYITFPAPSGTFQLLYVNGEYVTGANASVALVDNDSPKRIGSGRNGGDFFQGMIDEVRLWDQDEMDLTLAEFVTKYLYRRLTGSEPGLAGYWRLDAENGSIVTDYAGGSHGALRNGAQFTSTDPSPITLSALTDQDGNYELRGIDYDEGTTYTVTPTLAGHNFDPASRSDVHLAADSPSISGINFTDTTAIVVSGQITYEKGGCPQPNVEILVNGVSSAVTDAEGRFSVTIINPGSVEIVPSYGEHAYEPASVVYDQLTASVENVHFTNVETRTLDGRVVGGDCGLPLGNVTVNVYGTGGCNISYQATADEDGNFQFTDLPAVDSVTVEATVTDDPTITFAPKQVPLAASDTTADFIYRAPPQITLTDWPLPQGSCGMTVMEQLETYGFYVNVVEQYGDKICPVSTGQVIFRNEIADSENPDTLALTGEPVYYELTAGTPNITGGGAHPYQKRLGIEVQTGGGPQAGPNGYSETLDQWVIVEGNRPRDKTFATVTPEIPLLILRDPPGDQSYSYVTKGSSMCTSMGLSALTNDGSTNWAKAKLGHAFSLSTGTGVSYGVSYAIWGEIGNAIETGSTTISQEEAQLCHTATETFSTSDNELVTGSDGDVFIGGAMNFLYALTDVLEFDPATCKVTISQDVIFAPDKFATTYAYTEDYISGNLIPRLQGLAANPNTSPDSSKFLQDQIDVWKQALARNEELKEKAKYVENRSFSSGTAFESTTTSEASTSTFIEFNTYIDEEIAIEGGFETAGSGGSAGHRVRLRTEFGKLEGSSTTSTNTVGYVLADDDPGDYFSVDILTDKTYGTPVFKTVSGESSCLWEDGTRARDAIQLQADAFVKSDVDPNSAASFQITLSNPSQTETDEVRQYYIAPLQETNPDGAGLRLNGEAFSGGMRFTVPTRSSVNAVLTVERGPEAFSYEDLKIMAYPECEYNAWQNGAPLQIADTLSVTVHFESACSPVTLSLPEDGWIVNGQSGDIVQVLATDFDPSALNNLKLQVSPEGKNDWTTVTLLTAAELTSDEVLIEWNVSDLPDGVYRVRLAVACNEGTTYSAVSTGTIDRSAPVVLGTPEPQDGVYHVGDEIAIEFNEMLDCASFDADDAVLTAKETGDVVPAQVLCEERRIRLVPTDTTATFENATIQATILSVADPAGNPIADPVSWTFHFNTNSVRWKNALLATTVVEGESPLLSATLLNTGGTEESFTLAGYPTWLTPDLTSGTLPSESSQSIVFSLDGSLARGTYRDTVIAQTARGDEPLFVEVSVQCPGPGWSFTEADAAQFAGSMHLVTGFYIDQIPFLDENDLVAAFVGDELRGLAEAVRVVPQDEYAVFLNVYGDTDGETINFRVWDASECIERQVVGTRTFENGIAYGSASSLDSLSVSGAVLQEIALHDGWTWISLGVESTDMTIKTVMQRVRPVDGNVIRGQSAYAQYVAGKGWIGTLTKLQPGVMYQILVDSAQALEFIGEPIIPNDRPLAVEEGWNWLGYLPDSPLPPATALASFEFAEGDLLRSQTQSSEFTASGWQGPLTTMNPGEGYLLRVENGGTLTYPGAQGEVQKTGGGVIAFAGKQGGPDWSVDTRKFERVMTVTGTIQVDGLPLAGGNHVIGAFVDGEVRGLAKPIFAMDAWLYFVPVYSNTEGESVIFKVFDANQGKAVELAETFKFQSTLALGTPREPIVFHNGAATGVGISANSEIPTEYDLSPNYPNPFNPTTQIRYAVKEHTAVELTVYNILGQEVMRLVDEKQAPGWYTINFDGSSLASGVYFYRLQAGNFAKTQTMTLVK